MFGLLLVLLLVVPIAELWVILEVADYLGAGLTIGLLIVVSLVGAWLVKREGLGIWRSINQQIRDGQMPTRSLVDGGLVLVAGALMLTPGFLTDVLGLLLLFPPTRAPARGATMRYFRNRYAAYAVVGQTSGFVYRTARSRFGSQRRSRWVDDASATGQVIDLDEAEFADRRSIVALDPYEVVDFDGNTGRDARAPDQG
ncbi:MAG: hypothetical protein JJLCMIEE_01460 [Acidimicrobiales bacterium]|nr:MAG: FxsA family protein [Actinomycetota bacterium]MBV6508399.1 hypothetical protein [Acidimicrobiales bacterium]